MAIGGLMTRRGSHPKRKNPQKKTPQQKKTLTFDKWLDGGHSRLKSCLAAKTRDLEVLVFQSHRRVRPLSGQIVVSGN